MKKMFLCLTQLTIMVAAVLMLTAAIDDIPTGTDYASVASAWLESPQQGAGACTHPNCGCMEFNQRPGYYQCWCGHQRYTHK